MADRQDKVNFVIDSIMRHIKSNNLQPGDRLPSERTLAQMFSVGRPVVREAVGVLHVLNIIEVRKQGGIFVALPYGNSRFDYFRLYMQSGQISLSEVYDVRMILEVECIALAAENITDEQLDQLEDILSNVSIDDAEGFARADNTLHQLIYASTGNRALHLIMQTISTWTMASRNFSNIYEEVRKIVHADHKEIYLALKSRDVERCRNSMRQHILHLEQIDYIGDTIIKTELSKLLDNCECAAD